MNQLDITYDPLWEENPSGEYQDREYVIYHMGYDDGKAATEKLIDKLLNEIYS